jgi:hypothetical protein
MTNFDGEITYATAFPPDPEVMLTVPLPFVGEEDTEYVALKREAYRAASRGRIGYDVIRTGKGHRIDGAVGVDVPSCVGESARPRSR